MIVVDTNILVHLYFHTDLYKPAEQLYKKDPAWCAPLLWRSEFLNVAALYFRKKLVTEKVIAESFTHANEIVDSYDVYQDPTQMVSIIISSNRSAYDCEYVTLAKKLNIPLLTYDKQLLTEFKEIAIKPEDFFTL